MTLKCRQGRHLGPSMLGLSLRRIWLVATLLLAWALPARLAASAVNTVVRTRIALVAGANLQDDASTPVRRPNVTSSHNPPPICAEAQRAEHVRLAVSARAHAAGWRAGPVCPRSLARGTGDSGE